MGQIMHPHINASMNVQRLHRCTAYAHMCNVHFVKKGDLQTYQLREIYIQINTSISHNIQPYDLQSPLEELKKAHNALNILVMINFNIYSTQLYIFHINSNSNYRTKCYNLQQLKLVAHNVLYNVYCIMQHTMYWIRFY